MISCQKFNFNVYLSENIKKYIYLGDSMIKVVVDAFGGDNAPGEVVKGVVQAINENGNLHVIMTGKQDEIEKCLESVAYAKSQITIVNATEVITNDESPTEAIRFKKDSSLVKAFDIAKEDNEVVGLVSAGSTGAVLTGGFMKFGRLKGIHRPALCPVMPTKKGTPVAICDSGANMDCKPEYLEQFAMMGNAYLKTLGVKNPKVALLNVGTEDHKGDARTKEVFALLKANKDLNFVGNMEARDLLSGDYDLIVTDGFSGNVLLKASEGCAKNLLGVMKEEIKSSAMSKIGALFMKKTFKEVKKRFDYNQFGGAVLLGCKKLLVKGHGSSKDTSFYNCIKQVVSMSEGNLVESIKENLSKLVANE